MLHEMNPHPQRRGQNPQQCFRLAQKGSGQSELWWRSSCNRACQALGLAESVQGLSASLPDAQASPVSEAAA